MATDNIASTSSSEMTGTNKGNVYDTSNTKDYSEAIEKAATDNTEKTQASINENVDTGTKNLGKIDSMGESAYNQQYDVANRDYQEAISAREAIEANNGNRDGIGHSQYGAAEQSLSYQKAAIAANIQQLKLDTARQIADLKSQGDYQSANAALSNMQTKLQMMYEDQMKQDTNLYNSYSYEYGLQLEDEEEQIEQAETDKAYLRTWAIEFLQMGIMPTQEMLDAIGMTAEEAEPYRAYYAGSGYGSGSGSSSSGSGSGNTGSTYSSEPTRENYIDQYNNAMSEGNYVGAKAIAQEARSLGLTTASEYDYAYNNAESARAKTQAYYETESNIPDRYLHSS